MGRGHHGRWPAVGLGLALVIGCGPTLRTPIDGSGGEGSDEGTTAGDEDTSVVPTADPPVTTGSPPTPTTISTSGFTDGPDDGSGTNPVSLDVADPTGPGPGIPPDACWPPRSDNAFLVGVTALGDVDYNAAVFAETGGGKCPYAYRVVFAADPVALAEVIDAYPPGGPVPSSYVQLELDLPGGVVNPGVWYGEARHGATTGVWYGEAEAQVEVVTPLDAPEPYFQATVSVYDPMSPLFVLEGAFEAPYCNVVAGWGCGA